MDIQKDLPDTPAEVIEAWLAPIAEKKDYGWPPTEYNAWRYLLGSRSTLNHLQRMRWGKIEKALNPTMIINRDMDAIRDIFRLHVVGVSMSPSVARPEGSDSFRGHCDYLTENRVFPAPVILEETDAGLHVLDGFYRLCAFFYLTGYLQVENTETQIANVSMKQEVWLGKAG